jgi:2-methylcitrate dehydratase PrpD
VRRRARLLALDGFGCAMFGSRQPWSRLAAEHAAAAGGAAEATVWGTGRRVPMSQAPLANGTAVHAFEFDDVHPVGVVHAGSQVLPVVIAVAEARGAGADDPVVPAGAPSGSELLAAIVVGFEVAARIGIATGAAQLARGFHPSPNTGAFASAAAAGRLLGLDAETMGHALGIAGSFGGYLMAAQYGAMVKRLHAGHSAQAGLTAALLAARGVTGTRAVLEAPYGGFAATHAELAPADLNAVVDDLGDSWEIPRFTVKAYPCCGSNHTSLDAYRAIRARCPGLDVDAVERIDVRCSTVSLHHVGWPYEPGSVTTAQMNLAYCLAAMAVDGEVTVDQFEPDRLADPRLLAVVERIHVAADPKIDEGGRAGRHAVRLTVTTRDGRTETESVEHPRGSAAHPLSPDEIVEKYRVQAGRVLDPVALDELARTVLGLGDGVDDTERLSQLLAAPVPAAG